jgi:hypothetical protein
MKLIIAKPTFNALTETDPDNLQFSSEYNTLKYATQGTIQLAVNQATYYYSEHIDFPSMWLYYQYAYTSIDHNLGYKPFFAGYAIDNPTGYSSPLPYFDAGGGIFWIAVNMYVDSTKLYVMANYVTDQNSGTVNFDMSYRIFKNELDI